VADHPVAAHRRQVHDLRVGHLLGLPLEPERVAGWIILINSYFRMRDFPPFHGIAPVQTAGLPGAERHAIRTISSERSLS
jgi:hypothetical protein